ncbi:alpha/beta fold hydrolase [uncultured Tenacibaculum sp.]|uniref:alpha/beta fold hydrolase n=1 Tax=uncultured Tenacibaculum sp. TaxID=174713 RepID=UPI002613FCE6|nr:alpha/beta fold hydrolase [uncultured Tenacibaculum sp.]
MSSVLHSKIVGEGKPLVILHGFFGMGDNWKSHANKFAEDGYQVHLVDQRNHGRSFHSDDFSYELLVEDLSNYIEEHNLEDIYLLGHSMGGKTAMLFATEYPDVVKKLIVADIAPKEYPPHHQDIIKALESVDFEVQNSRKLIDEKLSELISEVGVRQFILKNTYRKTKDTLAFRFNLKSLSKNYPEVVKPLPSFTVFDGETVFLRGEKSGYILDEDGFLIKAHFPKGEIKTVPRAGHWLHAENPVDFYKEAITFLNK